MIENPDDVQITLKVTMSVKEWDVVRCGLSRSTLPEISLINAITNAFSQIRKIIYVNENEE